MGRNLKRRDLLTWYSKTQDVLEYVYTLKGSLVSVFWVHAGSKERFKQDYRKLAELVGLPAWDDPKQDMRPTVKDWFEGPKSGNWILVLDNADNKADFFPEGNSASRSRGLAQFIPRGGQGTIIITTRDLELADQLADSNVLPKDMMEEARAVQLFTQYYPAAIHHHECESIIKLLGALQCLPLAIVQVAAYLRRNRALSLAGYIENFNSTRACQRRLLAQPFNDLRREASSETILTTFSITFRQVQEQSPLSSSLLKLIACIDRQNIPHKLLAESGLKGADDEIILGEAISKLLNFSLLTVLEHGSAYEIHSLVHISIATFLVQEQEMGGAMEQAAQAFAKALPSGDFENWSVWRIYFPHTSALIRNVTEGSLDTAEICFRMSWYLRLSGRYSEAEDLARRSTQVQTNFLGQEHPSTLASLSSLAMSYRGQGRWKEAEELEVKVMGTRKRVLGQEHPDALTSMANLASTYRIQGRWMEAEKLEVKVMETRKRVLGQEHPDTLTSIANLASTYRNQGRWKEAEKLQVTVMGMRKKVLGQEHPDTLTSIANLASTYRDQGRWKEAEELQMKVMETRKGVLGQHHLDTLNSMANLAATYWNQGRWKEAEELFMKVVEASKGVLGQDHPDTLSSMANLASTYRKQGRWKEAEELDVKVVETGKGVLGQGHPDTLVSMNNLALTYMKQRRWKEAEELQVKVMETRKGSLGEGHPDTLTSMANLASTYRNQWRWKEAEELLVKVVEASRGVLGQDHSDTLRRIANLASTYRKQGRWKEAEELDAEVMEAREGVLGLTGAG